MLQYTLYEHERNWNGGGKMSILSHATLVKKLVESKHVEPTTPSILLISVAIFLATIMLMYGGILYTESSIKAYSECRDKIIGFEQHGMYPSPELFKLALSYCETR